MTAIPEDVRQRAEAVIRNYSFDADGLLVGAVCALILSERESAAREARAEERERCARIADPPLMHRKGKPGLWRVRRAAIASAIREQKP